MGRAVNYNVDDDVAPAPTCVARYNRDILTSKAALLNSTTNSELTPHPPPPASPRVQALVANDMASR
jgi:hypothetical protein